MKESNMQRFHLEQIWLQWKVAFVFYTRIPIQIPQEIPLTLQAKSTLWLPLVGLVVGGTMGLSYELLSQWLPHSFTIIVSLIIGILLTGAIHEDGFADCCDGFGGGWSKEQRLRIMKDSQLGTYGVLGLLMIFLLKWQSLALIPAENIMISFLIAHSWSRFLPILLMSKMEYVTSNASKSKAMTSSFQYKEILQAFVLTIPFVLWLPPIKIVLLLIGSLLIVRVAYLFFEKRIGGYTGDCLGAVQQITETLILILSIRI